MNVTLTFDPTDAMDLEKAADLISTLAESSLDLTPANHPSEDELREALTLIADPTQYGHNRLGYLRAVADAGEAGADPAELLAGHFEGNRQRFGGTHASIERTWKKLTRSGRQLIDDVDGRQVMQAEARPIVAELLG